MNSIRFKDLCIDAGARPEETWINDEASPITSAAADSRLAGAGALFVCMPSATRDTHQFLKEVAANGTKSCLVHSREGLELAKSLNLNVLRVEPVGTRFNFVVGRICRTIYEDPTKEMTVIGVTGTNGKTTTAWMLRSALSALGQKCAYLGTLGYQDDLESFELANTTPFPVELWTLLMRARSNGCNAIAMETSSHSLVERRVAGMQFDAGVFTNLTQDHLDFHGTMERYSEAKKLLFTEYAAATSKVFTASLNSKDPISAEWRQDLPCRVMTYGDEGADLVITPRSVTVDHIDMTASFRSESVELSLPIGGLFNVENAGSALSALLSLSVPLKDAGEAMKNVRAVPGRFEAVQNDKGIGVLVDYAHTPDALDLLLRSVRSLKPRKIITVFGCGGDRDRSKRPKMAAIASERSDVSIVTSDNPRTEDPGSILNDVVSGIVQGKNYEAILDRRDAIRRAVMLAEPDDVVVIAGKGHENYQIIGRTKFPMDDRELAKEALDAK